MVSEGEPYCYYFALRISMRMEYYQFCDKYLIRIFQFWPDKEINPNSDDLVLSFVFSSHSFKIVLSDCTSNDIHDSDQSGYYHRNGGMACTRAILHIACGTCYLYRGALDHPLVQ